MILMAILCAAILALALAYGASEYRHGVEDGRRQAKLEASQERLERHAPQRARELAAAWKEGPN